MRLWSPKRTSRGAGTWHKQTITKHIKPKKTKQQHKQLNTNQKQNTTQTTNKRKTKRKQYVSHEKSIIHKSCQARFLHVLCSVPGPSGRSGPKSNMICPISLLLSFLYWAQPNDTKSNMFCVMRLLLVMFPGGNRLTQNLIWFVSCGCCYPFFLKTTESHKI